MSGNGRYVLANDGNCRCVLVQHIATHRPAKADLIGPVVVGYQLFLLFLCMVSIGEVL